MLDAERTERVPGRFSVRRVSLADILVLRACGVLPPSTDFHGPHPKGRTPTEYDLAGLDFWISGDARQPSAYMATRYAFDLSETRDCLEIVGVEGSKMGVHRLMLNARDIAHERGWRLIGDIPEGNIAMKRYVKRALGMRAITQRWMVEPNG